MTSANPSPSSMRWPLARILVLVLAGVFLGLLADIRVEHVEVVHENRIAWTPIVYSAIMAVFCLFSAIVWNRSSRLLLRLLFLAGFIVGGLGFYFHNRPDFAHVLTSEMHAWTDPQMEHPGGPPRDRLALSLRRKLGLVGFLATLKRRN